MYIYCRASRFSPPSFHLHDNPPLCLLYSTSNPRTRPPSLTPLPYFTTTDFPLEDKNDLRAAITTRCGGINIFDDDDDCSKKKNNAPISDWDVSSVSEMAGVFVDMKAFNQDISKWKTSQVITMASMFERATNFNGDISQWNVAGVSDMRSMFYSAESFNQDISNWDVIRVTNMRAMFGNAKAFNQDISKWEVYSVTDMDSMFSNAQSFNQELCGTAWIFSEAVKKADTGEYFTMFKNSPGSICGLWLFEMIPMHPPHPPSNSFFSSSIVKFHLVTLRSPPSHPLHHVYENVSIQ